MKEAEKHYDLAIELIEKGLIDEAIKELKQAIRINPDYAEAHLILGLQLLDFNMDEAAREIIEGIRLNPILFDKLRNFLKNRLLNDLAEDDLAPRVQNLLEILGSIAKYINSDEKKDKDYCEEIRYDSADSYERKNVNKNLAMEIIAKALDTATNGGLAKAGLGPYKGKIMSAEQVQRLGLTKEDLIQAFLKDSRVISAGCENGEFHIETTEGKLSFKFIFEDEKTSGSA